MQVGKTIRLTGTSGSYGYSHSWSSSNKNIATVTGNGSTAEVKGVAVGTVTITHRYSSQWNGNTRTETYQVKVTKFADNYSGEAAIYYLANPAGDHGQTIQEPGHHHKTQVILWQILVQVVQPGRMVM